MTLSTTPAHRRKARLAAVFAAVLGLATATVTAVPGASAQPGSTDRAAAAATQPHPKSDQDLGDADRSRIAAAQAAGKKTVTLLVAAERDRSSAAADQLRALGGVVLKSDAAVDYLKVEMPTGKAEQAAKLSAVEAVDVDGLIPMDDPQPQGAQLPIPQTPPSASTPRINPYLPTGDTQAAQFALANPKWDGRGTKIAILDSGIDLDVPALQTTTTGLPKVVDWYNANSPTSGDATWISTTGRRRHGQTAVATPADLPGSGPGGQCSGGGSASAVRASSASIAASDFRYHFTLRWKTDWKRLQNTENRKSHSQSSQL